MSPNTASQQYYVYTAHNQHIGPVTAELIARGVLAGKVPENAFVAPVGASSWIPINAIAEIEEAVRAARATPSSMRPSSSGLLAIGDIGGNGVNGSDGANRISSVPARSGNSTVVVGSNQMALLAEQRAAPLPVPSVVSPASIAPMPFGTIPPPAIEPAKIEPAKIEVQDEKAPAKIAAKDDKEKKPVLDPNMKYLPLAIFGVFAGLAVFEVAIKLLFFR